MKISEIEISGFRGFRHKVTIPMGAGFTVITGRNGAGKTSVCDAIELALTKKLGRFATSQREKKDRGEITERGERIEDYLWWRGHSPVSNKSIRLSFVDDQGEAVDHTYEAGSSQPKNLDFLFAGNERPENPLELLCQTAILRDEHITALSTDLRETERFEFVNAAIGVSDLIAVERRASEIVSRCAEEVRNLEGAYQSLREQVARLTSEITEVKGDAQSPVETSLGNTIADLRARLGIQTATEKGASAIVRTTIVALRREVERLERLRITVRESSVLLTRTEEVKKQIELTTKAMQEAETRLKVVENDRSQADMRLREAELRGPLQSALAVLVEQGTRLNLQNGRCPLCGSEVAQSDFESHILEIRNDMARNGAEAASLAKAQADASDQYAAAKAEFDSITAAQARAKAELESLQQTNAGLGEEAISLHVETSEESISTALIGRADRLKTFEALLDALEARETNDRLIELRRQRDQVQKEADDLASKVEFMVRVSQGARAASDATKRVSREIVEERLAALNPLLSELYSRLKPHVAYDEVKYRMRGDVLRFLRLEVGDDINPRFTFSSGQRRALGLAFLLAVYLTRPWCKLKTLILDDPVQHIDDYRALHLAEVLGSIRQLGHQVICTVEDPALANLLCRRLRSSDSEKGLLVELGFSPESGSELRSVTQINPFPSQILLSA